MIDPRSAKVRALWIGGVIVLLAIVYRNSFDAPFIFDDANTITENLAIRDLATSWRPSARESTLSTRPLVRISFAINYKLGGLNPRGYHAVNFAFHAINTLLLFGIIRRTPRLRHADVFAMGVATVWALHPLQTEAVVYTAQRTELMMAMYYLLTLYTAIRAADKPKPWQIASVICCAAGMACKEVMVSAPLMVLLYDRLMLRQWRPRFYAELAGTWCVLIALMIIEPRAASAGFGLGVTSMDYLATQAGVIWHYIRLCVWPSGLTVIHDWPVVDSWRDNLIGGLLLLILLAATLIGCVKKRPIALLGAWFFFILAPTSSIVPIVTEIAAERRMYLPLAAVIVLAGVVVTRWGRAALLLTVAIAIAAALASDQRVRDYESEIALWQATVKTSPHSLTAHSSLAKALVEAGRVEEGIAIIQSATTLKHPSVLVHARLYANLSGAYLKQHKNELAQRAARHAISIADDLSAAHINLGIALRRMGRFDEAETALRRGLQLRDLENLPYSIGGNMNLAYVLIMDGKPAEADVLLRRVIETKPDYDEAHDLLGVTLAMRGRLREAIAQFEHVLSIDPDHSEARKHLDMALKELGQ